MIGPETTWISVALGFVGTLGIGGWLGALITNFLITRREAANRTAQFRKQQLEEFYGPLLSMHKEIRARSELRVKIQLAVDKQHVQDMLETSAAGVVPASDALIPSIMQTIRDEGVTLREILMPLYREMVSVFRKKMWLAEPETRVYFTALVEFVDVWDKVL